MGHKQTLSAAGLASTLLQESHSGALRLLCDSEVRTSLYVIYAFYAFYAWWFYFSQSGALAEGRSLYLTTCHVGIILFQATKLAHPKNLVINVFVVSHRIQLELFLRRPLNGLAHRWNSVIKDRHSVLEISTMRSMRSMRWGFYFP